MTLKNGTYTILNYATNFNELGQFAARIIDTKENKANYFEQGLRSKIQLCLASFLLTTYIEVLQQAIGVERELQNSQNYQD